MPRMLRHAQKASEELTELGIEHEFLFLPNDETEGENRLLDLACKRNVRMKKHPRARESIYATWNAGVRLALYSAITFWNADDRRFAPALAEGARLIAEGADVVYFPFKYRRYVRVLGFSILAKAKTFTPPEFDQDLFSRQMHCGPFFMASRQAFEKIGFFDETFRIAGDYDWATRAAQSGLAFKRSQGIGGIFTNDGTTLSGSRSQLHAEENKRVLQNRSLPSNT